MQNIIESLRKQRHQLLHETGEDVFSRHTSLLEIAIITLYNRLVNRLGAESEQFRSGGSVAALGTFARGLVSPNEAVPVLFLQTETLPVDETWHEEITLPLLEAGWKLDVQHGTVDHLLRRAEQDLGFFCKFPGARYISGSRQLVEQLEEALYDFTASHRQELLRDLHESVKTRRLRNRKAETWLEPDLIENPGGLADINAIRAACRFAAEALNLEDAIFQGYLHRRDVDSLHQAEKTFARLLALLQISPGEESTVLSFDGQELLADKLGYSARSGFLPVEAFMQQVWQLFHEVCRVSEDFWERVEEGFWEGLGGKPIPEEPIWLETGLEVRADKLVVHPALYPQTAADLIHLFVVAASRGLRLSNVTRQWIQHHRNVLDTAAGDPQVRRELSDLVLTDGVDLPLLRSFYSQGLLTALIPELASVHGLVQHDAFHVYPVDEHHLRTLTELKKLIAGDHAGEEPELTEIAQDLSDPLWLFLAALLHDIGKSAGSGHALRGGEMIPTIARRLGLEAEESDLVQFLVAQHLLLLDSAAMRDLADQAMLSQCALIAGHSERLEQLLLLSFAVMHATGPKAIEKWRQTPVFQLYEKVRLLVEKGEPSPQAIVEKIQHLRALVGKEVADLMTAAELEEHFAQLAPRYLLTMHPGAIARHLRLEKQLRTMEEPFACEVETTRFGTELTLLSNEMPGLLSRSAGILTLHDLNITGAQIYTKQNGVVLLVFQCNLPEGLSAAPDWNAVRADMLRLVEGKLALDYRIAAHASQRGYLGLARRRSPSQVRLDNESSQVYSILEVYSTDRVGLLYTITRTLLDLQMRIYVAKITTKVDQVADVFYIKTDQGQKVTDPEQIEEIKKALLFWLDGPEKVTQ